MTPPHTEPTDAAWARRARTWLLPLVLATAVVAVLAGLLLGRGLAVQPPAADAVTIGFLQDMKVHHAQAVAMSEIVHRRSSDRDLSYLAFDILSTQQGQIGIMSGWLEMYGAAQSAVGAPMTWMGHDGPMPGMATPEQVAELNALPEAQMEQAYLRLMIEHHRGALGMAQYAAEQADSPAVARLAQKMYVGQESEIDLMQTMLAERGGAPAPAAAAGGHPAQPTTGPGGAPAPTATHSRH